MALKASMRILVIDDQGPMRKIIKSMLNQVGFNNILEAEDGKVAWDQISKGLEVGEPIEFIIADLNMPKVDGLELLKSVRENPTTKPIPFLMVTSESEQSIILNVLKSGVDNFIVKPFSAQTMKEKIIKIFKQ